MAMGTEPLSEESRAEEGRPAYAPLRAVTVAEARRLYKADEPTAVVTLPLSVGFYGAPWRDAQDLLLSMMEHRDPEVRANAARGLGYIAMRFGKLDKRLVKPYLLRELRENTAYPDYVTDAIEDINHFLGWHIGKNLLETE